ncbi:MAG: response regulator [Pseudomonadota bacterium]
MPVLAIEDGEVDAQLLTRHLQDTRYQLAVAATLEAARRMMAETRPRAIILDVMLSGEQCWPFLIELKRGWETRDIPIMIERAWLLAALDRLLSVPGERKVLLIDDDIRSRYLLRAFPRRCVLPGQRSGVGP